jgi:hypothetical protein
MVDCLVKKLPVFSILQWVIFLCACAQSFYLSSRCLTNIYFYHPYFTSFSCDVSNFRSYFLVSNLYPLFFNKTKLTSLLCNQPRAAVSEIKSQIRSSRLWKCAARLDYHMHQYGAIVKWWLGLEKRRNRKTYSSTTLSTTDHTWSYRIEPETPQWKASTQVSDLWHDLIP